MGVEKTVCERLSLEFGSAHFVGSTSIEGIAVNGGIYENNGTLFVTTLRNTENGYVTRVSALGDSIDGGLSLISYIDVPAAVNQVSFESSKVFLTNGTDNYAADFTNPASPVQIDYSDNIDVTSGLVAFGDGYVTLTKTSSGGIKLEKIVSGQDEKPYPHRRNNSLRGKRRFKGFKRQQHNVYRPSKRLCRRSLRLL